MKEESHGNIRNLEQAYRLRSIWDYINLDDDENENENEDDDDSDDEYGILDHLSSC